MSRTTRKPINVRRSPINISQAVYDRLAAIKDEQQQRLDRQVSFTEVIEQLLEKAGAA